MALRSLSLDTEWNDIDFIEALEKSFYVTVPDEEPPNWVTVGHVFNWLEREVASQPIDGKCPTQMAFHLVRSWLSPHMARNDIKPDLLLDTLPSSKRQRVTAELGRKHVNYSHYTFGMLTTVILPLGIGAYIASFAVVALLIDRQWTAALTCLGMIVSVWVLLWGFGRPDIKGLTVADLARQLAHQNYELFKNQGATYPHAALWAAFQAFCLSYSDVSGGIVTRDTLLLDPRCMTKATLSRYDPAGSSDDT